MTERKDMDMYTYLLINVAVLWSSCGGGQVIAACVRIESNATMMQPDVYMSVFIFC
jgi:hypothetical protein